MMENMHLSELSLLWFLSLVGKRCRFEFIADDMGGVSVKLAAVLAFPFLRDVFSEFWLTKGWCCDKSMGQLGDYTQRKGSSRMQ